jgi:hypothetical protein
LNETTFIEYADIHIDLKNWNDEVPIFERSEYVFSFNETVREGYHVGTVTARDRDIDDRVV